MRANRRPLAVPRQPLARAGSRRDRPPRTPPSTEALRTRPPDSPVPAPRAPTWRLAQLAWPISVPPTSQLTSYLSNIDQTATMRTCNFDPFEHLSHVSSEPRSCYSEGASVEVPRSEHRVRGRSQEGSQTRRSTSGGVD